MSGINGIIVPSITFFDKNYELNNELNSILLRHIMLNGAKAIYLFGTTGEGLYFSDKLQKKIKFINLMLKINDKIPLMLGAFGNEVNDVINQIEVVGKKFNTLNFFIAPPFSKKLTADELKLYFENILGSVSLKNDIFLYHNPELFFGNEIEPKNVLDLLKFQNLKGIKDASHKINNYKAYIQLLSEKFSVFCGEESKFSYFLQLIPRELRKFSGLVPSIGNLVNICSKLYNAALEENILELHQFQEQLEDARSKIYDLKLNEGKLQRGLKHAFLHLYRNVFSTPLENLNIVSPQYHRDLDDTTKGRIEAEVNYLVNQKLISQLYFLNKDESYKLDDVIDFFSNIEVLSKHGKIKKIVGPYKGEVNTIYRVRFIESDLLLRFRTSKIFQYEDITKEKILFPILDGKLHPNSSKIREKIKEIINTKTGKYIFNKQMPPIIPVANLIYYDETKSLIPYIFTIHEYIHGKPLYDIIRSNTKEEFNLNLGTSKFLKLFRNIGEILGGLHDISFENFYPSVKEIGKNMEKSWLEIFQFLIEKELQYAKKNKIENIDTIRNYFKDNEALIEEEDQPVLLHNDFTTQNIIVHEDPSAIHINGLINFDKWGIGVRAQDFVKFQKWDIKTPYEQNLFKAFHDGYSKHYKIDKDFEKKIEIYSFFWLLKSANYEEYIKRKSEHKRAIKSFFQKVS